MDVPISSDVAVDWQSVLRETDSFYIHTFAMVSVWMVFTAVTWDRFVIPMPVAEVIRPPCLTYS